MATRKKVTRKKKAAKIKFELTKSSIGGIAVVCFCLFLWMFLAGVWTGQSLLSPYKNDTPVMSKAKGNEPIPFIKAVEKKKIIKHVKDKGN